MSVSINIVRLDCPGGIRHSFPDVTFCPSFLYWNSGIGYVTTNCLNADGPNASFGSNSNCYYIGTGSPSESPQAATAASGLVGLGIGRVAGGQDRTTTPNVGSVSSVSCIAYTRNVSVNDSTCGTVNTSGRWNTGVASYEFHSNYYKGDGTAVGGTVFGSLTKTLVWASRPKDGYGFAGWFVGGEKVTSKSSSDSIYLSGTDDRCLHVEANYKVDVVAEARFAPAFTVAFDANGGSGTMQDQPFLSGVQQGIQDNKYSPPSNSMVFDGWNTAADGSGTKYGAGDDGSELYPGLPGGMVTLYAQWRLPGFAIVVENQLGVGTLSMVNESTKETVATFAPGGGGRYSGTELATYRIVCTMSDGYVLPPKESDYVTPIDGAVVRTAYSLASYYVEKDPADGSGYTIAVSDPGPDLSDGTRNYYAAGRDVEVTATVADPDMFLASAYLYDTGKVFVREIANVVDNRFTIKKLDKSYYVRGNIRTKQYSATCEADGPSSSAFQSLSASPASGPRNTSVTFAATMKGGYQFGGWYLNGTLVSSSATYTVEITSDLHLVAKAKVAVRLGVSPSGSATLSVNGQAFVPGTAFALTLGESFSYVLTVSAANKFLNGWYDASDTQRLRPLAGFGPSGTKTPTSPLDIYAYIGDVDPSQPVVVDFAYAVGSDATRGSFSVDGVGGPQQRTLHYSEGTPPSVVLAAMANNGFLFAGWFYDEDGEGNPIQLGEGGVLVIDHGRPVFARFDPNPHAVCEWEGGDEPKAMTWRSKTYAASKPFNPSSCRVDALGYPPGKVTGTEVPKVLELKVDMFSAPDADAKPTASTTLTNIADQDARRLPVRRMERYMQVQIKANVEIDTLLVGTSMEGIAL